ncbi:MAG: hypothetical protein WCX07_05690 [Dehalococcoidales bacterium]|nr:hypothetical protein [Dehalococcoidales bacterium]
MDERSWYTFRCIKCNLVWRKPLAANEPKPKVCPKCGSPDWQSKAFTENK